MNSLANNVASPFVSFNVTASGASDLLIGYVQSIGSLASAVAQVVGGRLADRLSKRLSLAMVFSGVVGLLWIVTAAITNTEALALSYTAITLGLGFYAAGWSSFLGEASEGVERGAFLATFAQLGSLGALVALLMTTAITAFNPSYWILDIIAGAAFIASALVLRGMKEQKVERRTISVAGSSSIRLFYSVSAVYGLFWGFAWPLMTITTVRIVKASLFQYSLAQVIAVAATVGFQPLVGRLVDRDRKRWVFWGRMGLVAYPVVYMFMSSPWQLYAVNVLMGFTNSLLNIAFAAYLYDISPAGQRGKYSADFNLVTGATTMAGSLLSGYILTIVNSFYGLWESLAILYVVAIFGRIFSALLHLKLPAKVAGPTG